MYWRVTPLEFTNIMLGKSWAREELNNLHVAAAWYVAALSRHKRLPRLETLMSGGELEVQSPDDTYKFLAALQAAGNTNIKIEEVDAPPWLQ